MRLKRQQRGGGLTFWAGIVGDNLIGPFRVPDGVKMYSNKSPWMTASWPLLREKELALTNKVSDIQPCRFYRYISVIWYFYVRICSNLPIFWVLVQLYIIVIWFIYLYTPCLDVIYIAIFKYIFLQPLFLILLQKTSPAYYLPPVLCLPCTLPALCSAHTYNHRHLDSLL